MRSRRLVVAVVLLGLAAAACGNSKSQTAPPTTVPVGNTPLTTASAADLTKNVPRPGVKGVTASTIRVAVITAKTNPIGGKYHEFIDGIQRVLQGDQRHGRYLRPQADRGVGP